MSKVQMFWSLCAEYVEFLSRRRSGAVLMESRHAEGQTEKNRGCIGGSCMQRRSLCWRLQQSIACVYPRGGSLSTLLQYTLCWQLSQGFVCVQSNSLLAFTVPLLWFSVVEKQQWVELSHMYPLL